MRQVVNISQQHSISFSRLLDSQLVTPVCHISWAPALWCERWGHCSNWWKHANESVGDREQISTEGRQGICMERSLALLTSVYNDTQADNENWALAAKTRTGRKDDMKRKIKHMQVWVFERLCSGKRANQITGLQYFCVCVCVRVLFFRHSLNYEDKPRQVAQCQSSGGLADGRSAAEVTETGSRPGI